MTPAHAAKVLRNIHLTHYTFPECELVNGMEWWLTSRESRDQKKCVAALTLAIAALTHKRKRRTKR